MACAVPEIRNLHHTIQHLLKEDEKYISYNAKYLIAPGENYGSLMLAVDVKVDKNGKEKVISMVGKLCPPNEWIRRMFATLITFKKEVKFYLEIVPTLINFQKEQNVTNINLLDIFPKCLGARLNLNNTETVDDDAILLLENLKTKNYKAIDRMIGFNLPEAEIVLRDLALFHAVPLAYKITHPELFNKNLMPYLNKINIGQEMFDDHPERFIESINRHLKLKEDEFNRFEVGMNKCFDFQKDFPGGNEKYVTFVHRDMWVNNAMILYEEDKPIKSKLLDFQVITTGSPISDLVFVLFTSIKQDILEKYYDHLINIYHNSFVNCLKELKCDVSYFTLDNLKKEIDIYGPLEASHVLIMFKAIYADREAVKELSDFSLDEMFSDHGITDIYIKRLQWTANYFFERNWF